MRSFSVVVLPPHFAHHPNFAEAVKQVSIQQFSTNAAVLSFNVGVLHRTAGLDELQGDLLFFTPLLQFV